MLAAILFDVFSRRCRKLCKQKQQLASLNNQAGVGVQMSAPMRHFARKTIQKEFSVWFPIAFLRGAS
jgi:hypothetical protein